MKLTFSLLFCSVLVLSFWGYSHIDGSNVYFNEGKINYIEDNLQHMTRDPTDWERLMNDYRACNVCKFMGVLQPVKAVPTIQYSEPIGPIRQEAFEQ